MTIEIKGSYDRYGRRWFALDDLTEIGKELPVGQSTYWKDLSDLSTAELAQIRDRLTEAENTLQKIRSLTYGHGTTNL